MNVGSLFSGVGGGDLGFERAGWKIVWQVEIEKYCQQVLRTHWPGAALYDDIRECCGLGITHRCGRKHHLAAVDCLIAGVPCQDVSVAGKRAGLAGERTGLFFEFARLLRELRPPWFVFELFSSNRGRDFAEVLRVLMAECGYGLCWRVLDSRYFGVAQRRRRVFLVGCFGKPCPAEILFDAASGGGNSAPRGTARADLAVPLTSGSSGAGSNRPGRRCEDDFNIVASTLNAEYSEQGDGSENIIAFDTTQITSTENRSNPQPCHPLAADADAPAIAFEPRFARNGRGAPSGIVSPLKAESGGTGKGDGAPLVAFGPFGHDVARAIGNVGGGNDFGANKGTLACAAVDADRMRDVARISEGLDHSERLLPQGLDSARYRALGNAETVQVLEWIGRRLLAAARKEREKQTHVAD